jgi:hypothetical protein
MESTNLFCQKEISEIPQEFTASISYVFSPPTLTTYVEWNTNDIISLQASSKVNFAQYTAKKKLLKTSVKTGTIITKMKSAFYYRVSKIV